MFNSSDDFFSERRENICDFSSALPCFVSGLFQPSPFNSSEGRPRGAGPSVALKEGGRGEKKNYVQKMSAEICRFSANFLDIFS